MSKERSSEKKQRSKQQQQQQMTRLRELIVQLNWEVLVEYLRTAEGKEDLRRESLCSTHVLSSLSPLSSLVPLLQAVAHGCPADVVETFHQVDPLWYQRLRQTSGRSISHNVFAAAVDKTTTTTKPCSSRRYCRHCPDDDNDDKAHAKRIVLAFAVDPLGVCQRGTKKRQGLRFPLHSQCLWAPWNLSLALIMLQAFPEATRFQDLEGNLPLHLVFRTRRNQRRFHPHLVSKLFGTHPEAIQSPNGNGNYPLHLACADPAIFFVAARAGKHHPKNNNDKENQQLLLLLHEGPNLLRQLLGAYPEAAAQPNKNGWYPLHFLCANPSLLLDANTPERQQHDRDTPLDVFRQLVLAFPDAAGKHTREGQTPVEILCHCWKDLSIQWPRSIFTLVGLLMEAASSPSQQCTLLHIACQTRPFDFDFIRQILKMVPPEAPRTPRDKETRKLPLHLAFEATLPSRLVSSSSSSLAGGGGGGGENDDGDCQVSILPSSFTIKALIEAYPAACWSENKVGDLPLHTACQRLRGRRPLWFEDADALTLIGDCLLETHHKAAAQKNKRGHYPLVLACANDVLLESSAGTRAICRLVSAYPQAAAEPETNLRRQSPCLHPLHLLCQNRGAFVPGAEEGRGVVNAVAAVLAAHPGAAMHKCRNDMYPLHYVCRQRCEDCSDGPQVVGLLLDAFPQAAAFQQGGNHCPFHKVWERRRRTSSSSGESANHLESILCSLLKAFPEAAKATPRRFGEKSPTLELFHRWATGGGKENRLWLTLLQVAPESLFLRLPVAMPVDDATTTTTTATTRVDGARETTLLDWVLERWESSILDECIEVAYGQSSSLLSSNNGDVVKPTPLHVACWSMVEDEKVYQTIQERFPACAKTRDGSGNLPLHCFCHAATKSKTPPCGKGAILTIASTLISWHGQALYTPDSFGDLPFVAACRRTMGKQGDDPLSLSFLFLLLREYPIAVQKL